jgi:hypothetical protein
MRSIGAPTAALSYFLLTGLLFSCASVPSTAIEEPVPVVDAQPVPTEPVPVEPAVDVPPTTKSTDKEPEATTEDIAAVIPETTPPASGEEVPFDPSTITKEIYDSTKSDVQTLIENLNQIIRDKKYEEWVAYLGNGYRTALSDSDFLTRVSSSTILRKQGIVLKELRDYFIHVVVPSRAKDRVDDIEFIGQNRVKAFTVDTKGRRLRLYDLEKTPTGWKIVN